MLQQIYTAALTQSKSYACDSLNKRELELGAATMAYLVYLMDQ